MPTEPERPQSVTLCLGDGQPVVIEDPRLVMMFWKLNKVSPDICALTAGQVTIHLGRRPEEVTVEVPRRI